jgi:hypothetical protein
VCVSASVSVCERGCVSASVIGSVFQCECVSVSVSLCVSVCQRE